VIDDFSNDLEPSGLSHVMSSTKDGDGKDTPILTLVGGNEAAGEHAPPEGVDKATLQKLSDLKKEHRELDGEILSLISSVAVDQLLLKRLKKRKLMLKDLISRMEDSMLPDIIA
jgi:hypothetical protein